MKYTRLIYLSLLLSAFTLVGCSDYLDVNEDPNNLSSVESANVILPAAQLNIANALMGWDMGFAGGFWSQYWTQDHNASQFKFLDEYQETSFSNAYNNLLPYALNDLKAIMVESEEGEGLYFIAEVLSIFTWQIVTDNWGDIPYSEALSGDEGIFSPKFDTQESIYTDLLARIDALLLADYSNATVVEKFDYIYNGDMNAWMAFAKSLKLKLMLRLSETSGYNNAEVLAFVQQGGFLTESALISGSIWENKDGKQHPMVEFETGGAGYLGTNVIASRTLVDYLSVNADSRIDMYFVAPVDEDGNAIAHRGGFQGDFDSEADADGNGTKDDKEDYSKVVFAADTDIPLMTAWEVNFYLAEVYARAGNDANAKSFYDAGVQASFDHWGLENTITEAGAYAEWTGGTVEESVKQIAMQKWVAYCKLQHNEAFLERNRTKYPAVDLVDVEADRQGVNDNFPTGFFTLSVKGRAKLSEKVPSSPIYPNAVVTRNTTNPSQKVNLGQKVWWDTKAGI